MNQIGKRIRDLRLTLNLSQEELAARCELTKGYISQLENNLTSPSIATLVDILSALGTDLAHFFAEDEDEKIVFKKEDYIEKEEAGMKWTWLVPNAQKNEMEPVIVTLHGKQSTEIDNPHEGEEFGYVLEGEVVVILDKKKFRCKKGETFYFASSKSHSLYNPKDGIAKIIWISSPPAF